MDLRWDGLSKIGNWKSEGNYRLNFTKVEAATSDSDKDYGPITNKTFRVIIAIVNIFTFIRNFNAIPNDTLEQNLFCAESE